MDNCKKLLTVKENHLFKKAYSRGKCLLTRSVAVYVLRNYGGSSVRVGITVSKARGGAVERNRARRIIREGLRGIYPHIKKGRILIIVARTGCMGLKSTDIRRDLEYILGKNDLLERTDNK